MILEAMPRSMHEPAGDLKDRRLKSGKLKNWRRRYRSEVTEVPLALSQRPTSRGKSTLFIMRILSNDVV